MHVAVADDEPDIARDISSLLIDAGFTCDTYRDGDDLVAGLRRSTFDVVLLDWNMPGKTGIEVIRWAAENLDTPPAFVLLTSRSDPGDVVRGLEVGACDFIVKPEDGSVIIARIHAAARRGLTRPNQNPVQEYGKFIIDSARRAISVDGEEVKLTAKEFELAKVFFENLERPLSRNYLLGKIWGSSDKLETRTLDMHVSRVRSKLGLRPENGVVIQTVFGFGYRMNSSELVN